MERKKLQKTTAQTTYTRKFYVELERAEELTDKSSETRKKK